MPLSQDQGTIKNIGILIDFSYNSFVAVGYKKLFYSGQGFAFRLIWLLRIFRRSRRPFDDIMMSHKQLPFMPPQLAASSLQPLASVLVIREVHRQLRWLP
jgi:hypothetical protein